MHYYAQITLSNPRVAQWPVKIASSLVAPSTIDFQTAPSRYRHWKLDVDGEVATLTMDVDENGGLFEAISSS